MKTEYVDTLVLLLRGAIERRGTYVAELDGYSDVLAMASEAEEEAALGYAHIEGDPKNEENVFAAEQFEETALMYLAAAKKLRKDAGQ